MATEDKILDRVQKLLAIADHPSTGEHEREVAYAQANSLIAKHAIDVALLRMSQTAEQRRAPEKRRVNIASGTGMGIALSALRSILHDMAETYRCSLAIDSAYNADLYGASEDVAWVEMLFASTYFQLASQINPRWDVDKSYDENVYNFKVAGYAWKAIDEVAREHGGPDARVWEDYTKVPVDEEGFTNVSYWVRQLDLGDARWASEWVAGETTRKIRTPVYPVKIKGMMIAAYKRHAAAIGDDQPVATQSHHAYRIYFIEGFKHRMASRLLSYRSEMEANLDTIPGAAIALRDMADEAKQMMFQDYPEMDPEEQERRRREAVEAEAARLDAMTDKERTAYLEALEREARKANKPRKVRYLTYDESAVMRGRSAADSVNMNRSAGATGAGNKRSAIGE